MSRRVARIRRVLAVAHEKVTACERALSDARAALAEARATHALAKQALESSLGRWLDAVHAPDLEASADFRETLRRAEIRAYGQVCAADRAVAGGLATLVEARKDERRYELLIETIERGDALLAARAELRASDAQGARRRSIA